MAEERALDSWVGTERVVEDVVSAGHARALAATLDRSPDSVSDGARLPVGWHWIYFNAFAPRSSLGPDGHASRGGFLPPISHPSRMWAGGRLSFPGSLTIGERATRVSTIQSITEKDGRSGPLVFVTVRHEMSDTAGTAIVEEQDLVYLTPTPSEDGTRPARAAERPPTGSDWSEPFVADEVTLFRFSALTSNSHRIHFDERYATEVEGYPGIVVHGPLLALLLLDAGMRHAGPGATASSFRYRAARPLFCNEPFRLCGAELVEDPPRTDAPPGGRTQKIWAEHAERGVATEAELRVTPAG